jgi:hypothetical protein
MEGSEVALDVAMQQEYSNRMLLQRTYPKVIRDQPIFPWFSATRVSDGEYDISGLRFVAKPRPEAIETYLKENPLKTRRRRPQTGAD